MKWLFRLLLEPFHNTPEALGRISGATTMEFYGVASEGVLSKCDDYAELDLSHLWLSTRENVCTVHTNHSRSSDF